MALQQMSQLRAGNWLPSIAERSLARRRASSASQSHTRHIDTFTAWPLALTNSLTLAEKAVLCALPTTAATRIATLNNGTPRHLFTYFHLLYGDYRRQVGAESCIGLFTNRNIAPGEELTYDYNFQSASKTAMVKCLCGAENCRGFLGSRKNDDTCSDSDDNGESSGDDESGTGRMQKRRKGTRTAAPRSKRVQNNKRVRKQSGKDRQDQGDQSIQSPFKTVSELGSPSDEDTLSDKTPVAIAATLGENNEVRNDSLEISSS